VEIRGSSSLREEATSPTGGAGEAVVGALKAALGAAGKSSLLRAGTLSFLTVMGEAERPRALPISSCALAE
jgi:hypothetical protein